MLLYTQIVFIKEESIHTIQYIVWKMYLNLIFRISALLKIIINYAFWLFRRNYFSLFIPLKKCEKTKKFKKKLKIPRARDFSFFRKFLGFFHTFLKVYLSFILATF